MKGTSIKKNRGRRGKGWESRGRLHREITAMSLVGGISGVKQEPASGLEAWLISGADDPPSIKTGGDWGGGCGAREKKKKNRAASLAPTPKLCLQAVGRKGRNQLEKGGTISLLESD